jgi:hypothetical protein
MIIFKVNNKEDGIISIRENIGKDVYGEYMSFIYFDKIHTFSYPTSNYSDYIIINNYTIRLIDDKREHMINKIMRLINIQNILI